MPVPAPSETAAPVNSKEPTTKPFDPITEPTIPLSLINSLSLQERHDLLRHLSDNSVKANLTIQNKSKYDIHVYDGLVPTGSEVSRPAEIIPAGLTSPGGEWSALPTAATMSGIILYDTPDLKTVSVFYFRVNSEGKNTVKVTFGQRGLQLGDLLRKVEGDSSITNDAVHVYYDIDGVYHTILIHGSIDQKPQASPRFVYGDFQGLLD